MTILRRPNFEQIEDEFSREALQYYWEFLQAVPFLQTNFQFFELDFGGVVSNEKVKHSLGFQPLDIIVTSSIGAGTATFNYDKFTSTTLDITTSGAVKVRFFGGRYEPSNIR